MKRMFPIRIALAAAVAFATASLRADTFNNLLRVIAPRGDCQIRLPGTETYTAVLKGKTYPFGSVVRTGKGSDVVIAMSDKDAVRLSENTTVTFDIDHEAGDCRIVGLRAGELLTRLDVVNTNEFVVIDTPVGRGVEMIGQVRFSLSSTPLDDTLEVRAEASSTFKLIGPQFTIPGLKSGNVISVTTVKDNSMTRIYDMLGDYRVFVNKGKELNPDTSDVDSNDALLPVSMSTKSTVKIWREKAPVGGRLIVSVLATGPDGKGRESYAFAVGKDNVVTRSNVFDLPASATDEEADDGGDADAAAGLFFDAPAAGADDAPAAEPEATDAGDTGTTTGGTDNSLDDFLF